ncbi:MAG: PEP/pyruvate-binding domain-containing protein, partial [Roseiflexaceae bacterium]
LVVALDAGPATLAQVGGKGVSLARMARAGFPVPAGFLITTEAYRAFVETNTLQESIVALAKDATRPREDTSTDIRALFERASVPPDALHEIQRAYAALTQATGATSPLAVRSSATAEDLPGASFAGQHDSFLNVRGEQALLDAVKRCLTRCTCRVSPTPARCSVATTVCYSTASALCARRRTIQPR